MTQMLGDSKSVYFYATRQTIIFKEKLTQSFQKAVAAFIFFFTLAIGTKKQPMPFTNKQVGCKLVAYVWSRAVHTILETHSYSSSGGLCKALLAAYIHAIEATSPNFASLLTLCYKQ